MFFFSIGTFDHWSPHAVSRRRLKIHSIHSQSDNSYFVLKQFSKQPHIQTIFQLRRQMFGPSPFSPKTAKTY